MRHGIQVGAFRHAGIPGVRKRTNRKLGQIQKANHCGMGILQGIYQFAHKSKSEFKDWASDAPLDRFVDILDTWKTSFPSGKDQAAMQKFLEKNCPDWSREF